VRSPSTRYIESSAVVAALMEHDVSALEALRVPGDYVTSALTIVECAGRPFPLEPIRTLDAIHLATLELLESSAHDVTVVSRDVRVRENARALGFVVE